MSDKYNQCLSTCVLAPNHTLGNATILPQHCFSAPVIKPSATNVANSRAIGTTLSPPPGVMVPVHNAVPSDLSVKDERELKREKRKQSNRESARRSRLRKQAETEELATQVESLAAENTSLRSEIGRLTESSEKLRRENSALMVKLKDTAEPSPSKAAASPSSPRASAENFLSMIDSANAPSVPAKEQVNALSKELFALSSVTGLSQRLQLMYIDNRCTSYDTVYHESNGSSGVYNLFIRVLSSYPTDVSESWTENADYIMAEW
ncbi:common plant regulatory factor 1-like [Zea mays]|uniref:common plant regulatory factor 1-like n=1 Tax=Zea mays TaxID=4577 RepID=UPI001651CB15|nr:common plant regulatory factor 1-like [Zea mays]